MTRYPAGATVAFVYNQDNINKMYRIATWNVNSLRARLEHLRLWLSGADIEILALQETKVQDHDFPASALLELGYTPHFSGQKAYNGVAFASRSEGSLIASEIPNFNDPQARVLAFQFQNICIVNLYVPNGGDVTTDKYEYKLRWLDALIPWLRDLRENFKNLVIVGDFNITPNDSDVHDPESSRGQILCSAPERTRLQQIMALGFTDLFRQFDKSESKYTWWDYRGNGFLRNEGMRIDLILGTTEICNQARRCEIDLEPRRWERPSDHAPVILELAAEE